MNAQHPEVISVPFSEVPDYKNDLSPPAFVIASPDSQDRYSIDLFSKILTLGLSEISAFLDHQCTHLKNPIKWLNSLEKLIKHNVDHFNTRQLDHRHTKLISEIGLKRHTIQQTTAPQKRHNKKLNGYSDEKEYSFADVKEQLKSIETPDEKIVFLHGQIFDYRQNPPEFVSLKEQLFDRQCELEIERIEKQELLIQKISEKRNASKKGKKMPYTGDLNVICDVFHQLINTASTQGSAILPWTITETTEFICNTLCEADGSSINPASVRTYLSGNRLGKRPKTHREVRIN